VSPCYRFDAFLHSQFREDVVHMAFDCIDGEHQFLRDLRVGCTTRDQLEHLLFAITQGFQQRLRRRALSRRLWLTLMCHYVIMFVERTGKPTCS
jgi:hypothetical protein